MVRTGMKRGVRAVFAAAGYCLLLPWAPDGSADDWPTYHGDNRRSGVSSQRLTWPLSESWVHRSAHTPSPAWPGPAKHDYWHRKFNLQPRVIYDRAHHAIAADGSLYYGTSADDSIVCLDRRTGAVRWTFSTEGPVRLAPTWHAGRVYAGSDDGYVYCLSALDGRMLWKFRPGPDDRKCIGNGRLISRWPVRSGVVIEDGIAYSAAGLFPTSEGVFLAAVDAMTGEEIYRTAIDQSVQGYMLVADDYLLLPSGRAAPGVWHRGDGRRLGAINSAGGGFALVTADSLAAGSGDGSGELSLSDPGTLTGFVSFAGLHLIARDDQFFVHRRDSISALQRPEYVTLARQRAAKEAQVKEMRKLATQEAKTQVAALEQEIRELGAQMEDCWLWRTPCRNSCSFISAGDVLLAGGDGSVTAYRTLDGKQIWAAEVEGSAYGLCVTGNQLVVSTDTGAVYCFRSETPPLERNLPVKLELSVTDASHSVQPGTKSAKSSESPVQSDPAETARVRSRKDRPIVAARAATSRLDRKAIHGKNDAGQLAESILARTGADQGFCVILGTRAATLACEIARRSRLRVICIDSDRQRVASTRERLRRNGLYGKRVVVHHGTWDGLNGYPPYFANLIVCGPLSPDASQRPHPAVLTRVVRPGGGTLVLTADGDSAVDPDDWLAGFAESEVDVERIAATTVRPGTDQGNGADFRLDTVMYRRPLDGAGQWTHGLADPGNTACTMDRLVRGPLAVQWFGAPGPRPMADRHHRNVTPLYKDGRLFVPGEDLVIAVDAYNGTILWRREIASALRLGAFLDCSNMVVDGNDLHVVAGDVCHRFDVDTGEPGPAVKMPQLRPSQPRHWGYIARAGDLLVGSGRKPGSSYREQSYAADLSLWYDNMSLVTSDYLFAIDPRSGKPVWTHESGTILNTTLTIGGGRVYFVESHSPAAAANQLGRMPMKTLLEAANDLVALDLVTGRPIWRHRIDLSNCRMIAYLSYAQGKLVLSGNRYVDSRLWYYFYGLDAGTGELTWERSHNSGYPPGGDHGEQNRHPTIVDDTVYTYPLAYKLHTGEPVEGWKFSRNGHGCGNISASAGSLYWRGGNPWRCDVDANVPAANRINSVTRPGCWINILPAGGLLLIPEASSGCTCAFPLQTSMAYVPASLVPHDDGPAESESR